MSTKAPFSALAFAALLAAQGPYPADPAAPLSIPEVTSPVIYGVQNGSPLRSDDSGLNWTPLYVFPSGTPQGIASIHVQPDNPTVVYAVTSMDRGGVWKSADSGRTWSRANSGLPAGSAAVESFTIAGNQTQTLYARIGGQIYRSTTGGSAWTARGTLPAGATAVGIGRQAPARMYTMTRGGVVQRSSDEGASWSRAGSLENDNGRVAVAIYVDPQDHELLFVRTEVETSTGRCNAPSAGLLASRDGGNTLTFPYETGVCNVSPTIVIDRQRPNVHLGSGLGMGTYCKSTDRGARFTCQRGPLPIGIDPRNGDIVYGSGSNVSRNAGESFERVTTNVRPTLPTPGAPIVLELEEGGQNQSQQVFAAIESGSYRLPFTAVVTEGAWLTLASASGTTGTNFRLNVSAAGLVAGTYDATVRLTAADANNSPAGVRLQLRVLPRAVSGLRFQSVLLTGDVSVPRHLYLDSGGGLSFYTATNPRLQRLSPQGAVTSILGNGTALDSPDGTPAAQAQIPLLNGFTLDAQGVPYWSTSNSVKTIRNGVVATLLGPDNTFGAGPFPTRFGSPRSLAFDPQGRLYVPSAAGLVRRSPTGQIDVALSPPSGTFFNDLAITPDGTIFLSDSLNHRVYRFRQGQLTTIAGTGTAGYNGDSRAAVTAQLNRPVAVDVDAEGTVFIAEGGGNRLRAITADGQIFTVIGGQAQFALNPDGTEGTAAYISPDDIAIDADGSVIVAETLRITRFRRVRGPRPEVSQGAMRHAASGAEMLAPGSLFSLYGSNFAEGQTIVSSAPWPTTVGGVSVVVSGRPAPLYFVSANQINGQIPYETAAGQATAQVRTAAGNSAQIPFPVAARAPGILIFGDNRAVAVNPDGSVNTEGSPAPQGSVLLLYLTGIGALDNPVATGAAAIADPLSRPTAPVRVLIGDAEARVLFLGLAPGFVGLAQANIELPRLPPGNYTVALMVGEAVSNLPSITLGE